MQSFLLLLLLSCPWPVACSSGPPSVSIERDSPEFSPEPLNSLTQPQQDKSKPKSMRSPKSVEDVGCIPINGTAYSGKTTTTDSGVICQKWSVNTPHESKYHHVGDHNYCRDTFGELKTWCLTTDPGKRWEYCDIPYCSIYTKGKNKAQNYKMKATTYLISM